MCAQACTHSTHDPSCGLKAASPSHHKKAGRSLASGPYGCSEEQLAFPPLLNQRWRHQVFLKLLLQVNDVLWYGCVFFSYIIFSTATEGFWDTEPPVDTRQAMGKASQGKGQGSSSACAGPGSGCPGAQLRAGLQPSGANFLLICSTVHSTATICPEGCLNPLPSWWVTSTITRSAGIITHNSVNPDKLQAFDNTVF